MAELPSAPETRLEQYLDYIADNMGTGRDPVIEQLNVTENGTYPVEEGIDGYGPVLVNVPGGGANPTVCGTVTCTTGEFDIPDPGFDPTGFAICLESAANIMDMVISVMSWTDPNDETPMELIGMFTESDGNPYVAYLPVPSGTIVTKSGNSLHVGTDSIPMYHDSEGSVFAYTIW